MLGNRNQKQKQRYQLVFKLFKSMDPYLPSLSQDSEMRKKLLSILKQNAQKIIPQQASQQDQQSFQISPDKEHNKLLIRSMANQVYNIAVANGQWWDPEAAQKKQAIQEAIRKQLQAEKQSKIIRKQIQTIHNHIHHKFHIKKQPGYTSYTSSNIVNYNYNNNDLYNHSYNSAMRQNSGLYAGTSNLQQIPMTNSYYSNMINDTYINSHRQSSRQQQYKYLNSGRHTDRATSSKGYQTNSNIIGNCYNSNPSSVYPQHNQNLQKISDKFSNLRLALSQIQFLPMKNYRHQTDLKYSKYVRNNGNNASGEQFMQLGIQSQISNKVHRNRSDLNLVRSKSEIGPKKNTSKQKEKQKINKSRSQLKLTLQKNNMDALSKKSSLLNTGSTGASQLRRRISQKHLKQSQKLEMQIMSSLLHKKMMAIERPSTIKQLVK